MLASELVWVSKCVNLKPALCSMDMFPYAFSLYVVLFVFKTKQRDGFWLILQFLIIINISRILILFLYVTMAVHT